MVDHFGTYNPWDMSPDTRAKALAAEASGGFVFRTGTYNVATGETVGDGLCIVNVASPLATEAQQGLVLEGTARRVTE